MNNIELENYNIDSIKFQKMLFLYNAILMGWTVKMKNNKFIFNKSKKSLNKEYILNMEDFIKTNCSIENVLE